AEAAQASGRCATAGGSAEQAAKQPAKATQAACAALLRLRALAGPQQLFQQIRGVHGSALGVVAVRQR
ncbi:hypothetical protein, partial [Pseudomonas citronellolis]|uniref:hypothetical protein n=1 Tax=Pseudomonas citronellolis TaxID=53408 RepID=UPI003AAB96BF